MPRSDDRGQTYPPSEGGTSEGERGTSKDRFLIDQAGALLLAQAPTPTVVTTPTHPPPPPGQTGGFYLAGNRSKVKKLDISFDRVKQRAVMQIKNNSKIKRWFRKIIQHGSSKPLTNPNRSCKGSTVDDFIEDTGKVLVPVYIMDRSFRDKIAAGGRGKTKWIGVGQFYGYTNQPDQSIALDAYSLFVSDYFDTDAGDERDAAELLIHEFTHWLTAYCTGEPRTTTYFEEGVEVQKMIDWSIPGGGGKLPHTKLNPKPDPSPLDPEPGPSPHPLPTPTSSATLVP